MTVARHRAAAFCGQYGLRVPILLAPMAGECALSIAVATAGGLGACGALLMKRQEIMDWAASAPYPVQRGLTAAMRAAGQKEGDVHRMQAWAGHAAALAKAEQVADVVRKLWESRLRRSWRDAAVSG